MLALVEITMTNILIVDDDEKVLKTTGEALRSSDYDVTLTESPETGLKLIRSNPDQFDLILLDWKLRCPLDGDMVLKLIKHIYPNFKIPIIFITAHTKISSKYLMRLGAFDTLSKPLTREDLLAAVERALGKKSENPHRHAPAELNSQELKRHEMIQSIIEAVTTSSSLKNAAIKLGCSRMTLYRWLRMTNLHELLLADHQHRQEQEAA